MAALCLEPKKKAQQPRNRPGWKLEMAAINLGGRFARSPLTRSATPHERLAPATGPTRRRVRSEAPSPRTPGIDDPADSGVDDPERGQIR